MVNSKNLFLFCILLLTLSFQAIAQMPYWVMPPKRLNMVNPTIWISTIAGLTGPYKCANAAFDENGTLLFYVTQDGIGLPNSTAGGTLGYYIPGVPTEGYYSTASEIAIVPIPGSCKEYYVIYGKDNPVGSCPLMYTKVNCSSGSPVVSYNGPPRTFYNPNPPYNYIVAPQAFPIGGHAGSDNITIAVSNIYTGSGPSARRFLYSAGSNGIYRSEITSTGITNGVLVLTLNNHETESYELELSWGGNLLAWTSASSNKVYVIQLTPSTGTYVSGSLQSSSILGAKGLEFDNSLTVPKLYVTGSNGLHKITLGVMTVSMIPTPTLDLSKSHLEYAKNGMIYGISPTFSTGNLTNTKLVAINPTSNAISSTNVGIDSRFTYSFMNGVFTLPDQIDGEDYTYFNGFPTISPSGLTINGLSALGNCNGGWIDIPSCNPITLNAAFTGGIPFQYKIDIMEINCYGNQGWPVDLNIYNKTMVNPSAFEEEALISAQNRFADPTSDLPNDDVSRAGNVANVSNLNQAGNIFFSAIGPNSFNYHGAWVSGSLPSNLDLRTLVDGAGRSLNSSAGYFSLALSVKNQCGYVRSRSIAFKVINPVPAQIAFEVYDMNNPQTYLAPSQSIGSPINVGTASLGYRINNSTGTIASHRVLIEEVTNTGALVRTIYDVIRAVSGVTNLTYENLNNYCVSAAVWSPFLGFNACTSTNPAYTGYNGYFSYSNGQLSIGKYFKLTVSVGNICGISSNWTYLYVGAIGNKMAASVSDEVSVERAKFVCQLFPNPAQDFISLKYKGALQATHRLEIMDMVGRMMFVEDFNSNNPDGEIRLDVRNLSTGAYFYRFGDGVKVLSGRFTKL